jgi:hypothetical protein
MAILGATVLIPAAEDLEAARWQADKALAVEEHRLERLNRYEEYLAALDNREPSLILSLAVTQLNQIPEGRAPIANQRTPIGAASDASVFPSLEPPPLRLPERRRVESTLQRLTTDNTTRLWLIAGGAACVLIGLMPPSMGWSARRGRPTGPATLPGGAHVS